MVIEDVVLLIEFCQFLLLTHNVLFVFLLFEFHVFKVFGIICYGLSEFFDLIFKILIRIVHWMLTLVAILQINDMVLSLDELILILFFSIGIACQSLPELLNLSIIFSIVGLLRRNWGIDLRNSLFECFNLLLIYS